MVLRSSFVRTVCRLQPINEILRLSLPNRERPTRLRPRHEALWSRIILTLSSIIYRDRF